jgi:hypothetical protein
MDSDDLKKFAVIGAVVIVLAGAGWFFLRNSAPPTPEPGPGQTIQNPFGTAGPPGAPATTSPGASSAPATAGSQPAHAGGPAAAPRVPTAGTYDPAVGFGPSAGGPFKRR